MKSSSIASGSRPGRRRRRPQAGGSSKTASTGAPGMRYRFREADCEAVWTVSTLVAPALPGVTEVAEKLALYPAGSPVTLSATAPVKVPPREEMLMLKFAAAPGLAACLAGVGASASGAG